MLVRTMRLVRDEHVAASSASERISDADADAAVDAVTGSPNAADAAADGAVTGSARPPDPRDPLTRLMLLQMMR